MFSRKVSTECEIHIRPLMVHICGTLQGHKSSRQPHNTADLKTESSSALSIVLTSAEAGDIGTVMPVLAGSTFSQVFRFLHWVCVPEHITPMWPLLKGKLPIFSALIFILFRPKEKKKNNCLWGTLSTVFSYFSYTGTLFSLHLFSIQTYFKCLLQNRDRRKSYISVTSSLCDFWCWSWRGIEINTKLQKLTAYTKRKETHTFWEVCLGLLKSQ